MSNHTLILENRLINFAFLSGNFPTEDAVRVNGAKMQTLTAEPVLVPPSHPRDSGMSVSRVRAGLGSALRSVQPARPRCGAAASRQPGLGGNTSTPALSFITSSSLYLGAQSSFYTFQKTRVGMAPAPNALHTLGSSYDEILLYYLYLCSSP